MTNLTIVIPTYNEKDNIPLLLERLESLLAEHSKEVIVVDDNSPDQTWSVSKELEKKYSWLKTIRRTTEKGLSSAVLRGFEFSEGHYLFVIDADLQHDEKAILPMLEKLEQGADLVIASRKVGNGGIDKSWSFIRRLMSQTATFLAHLVVPHSVTDPMSGFFAVKREHYISLHHQINPRGFKILLEFVARMKTKRIEEVGYVFKTRTHGESKLSNEVIIDYLVALYDLSPIGQLITRRFIKYCLVGFFGLGINNILIWSGLNLLDFSNGQSLMLAIVVGIPINFILNDRWTFKDKSKTSKKSPLSRFINYLIICSGGIVVYYAVAMYTLQFTNNIYISNLFGIVFSTIWNYTINSLVTWRVK